jgi:hypothetical protein
VCVQDGVEEGDVNDGEVRLQAEGSVSAGRSREHESLRDVQDSAIGEELSGGELRRGAALRDDWEAMCHGEDEGDEKTRTLADAVRANDADAGV